MSQIQTDKHTIHYECKGQGAPLLLLNGMHTDLQMWNNFLPFLEGQFECILFDYPEAGRSVGSHSSENLEELTEVIITLLDHLNLGEVNLMGFSLGSALMHTFASTYPKRCLKLVALASFDRFPLCSYVHSYNQMQMEKQQLPSRLLREVELPWFYSSDFLADQNQIKHLLDEWENNPYPISIESYESQLKAIKAYDLKKIRKLPDHPCLLVAGQNDLYTPLYAAKKVKEALPHAKLEIIPKGSHLGYQEQILPTVNVVLEWLLQK